MFVDADAHVDECAETWSYFPKSLSDARPAEMFFDEGQEPAYRTKARKPGQPATRGLWIDGHVFDRRTRSDEQTLTTVDTRELYDVPARIKDMDALGIDVQIIYPSLLLEEVTRRPEMEIAICESYNRWIADRCSDTNGRMRWNTILPLRSMPDALKEMRRCKEEGAVGIFKRAMETNDRPASDPYYFPMYELAQELDLPISIHISSPYSGTTPRVTKTEPGVLRLFYLEDAFLSLLRYRVPDKFPTLRFSFVESGSGWLPHVLWLARYTDTNKKYEWRYGDRSVVRDTCERVMAENRLYVSCEPIEDLVDIVDRVGNSNLHVGTDYSHQDRSSLLKSHAEVMEIDGLDEETKVKLTETNARVCYGLA